MADPADTLLAGYDPASGDTPDPYAEEVADFKRRVDQPRPMDFLRQIASAIPTDDRESTRRGGPGEYPEGLFSRRNVAADREPLLSWVARTSADSGGGPLLTGMGRAALTSTANWLEGHPEWSDMISPTGGGFQIARPAARAVVRPPKEWAPEFVGPHRADDPWTRNPGSPTGARQPDPPSFLEQWGQQGTQAAADKKKNWRNPIEPYPGNQAEMLAYQALENAKGDRAAAHRYLEVAASNDPGIASQMKAARAIIDREIVGARKYDLGPSNLYADAGKGSKVGNIVNASAQEVPFTQRLKARVDAMRQDPAIGKGEMVAEISRMRGEEFRKLYAQGLTRAEIAEMLGLSKNNSNLFNTYRTSDMPTRRAPYRKGPVPEETIDQIMALRTGEKPLGLRAISSQTGLTPELVSRLLRERGVELRPVLPEGRRHLADVPPEAIERIRQGRAGANPRALQEIAAELGMPLSTVRDLITIHGIAQARAARPPVAQQRKLANQGDEVYHRIRDLRNTEPRPTSIRKIGDELGLNPDMIRKMRQIMRDQGIDVKSEASSLPGTVLGSQSQEDRMLQPYD